MKKVPVTIRDLDVQPISDDDLQAFEINGAQEFQSTIRCCNGSDDVTITECGVEQ